MKTFTYEVDFVDVIILSCKSDFGFNVRMFKFICEQLDQYLKIFLCYSKEMFLEEFSELKSEKKKKRNAVQPGQLLLFVALQHSYAFLMSICESIFLIIH